MSVEIAWKQNILVTDFHQLKSLLVVFGFGSQAFVCGFSRQNINSVLGTSNAWSTIHLSHRPSDQAYYIVNWRISILSSQILKILDSFLLCLHNWTVWSMLVISVMMDVHNGKIFLLKLHLKIISRLFLLRQIWIVKYYVKYSVK